MIKSVTVVNHLGESLKLDLASPEKSGFIVKSIEGLGPVKATVNTTKMSTTDGALYFDWICLITDRKAEIWNS